MFSLNKQTDYALIAISYLQHKTEYIPLSDLIKQTQMPQRFLARITADLVRNGILESKEGKSGGYKLLKQPNEIPLLHFLQIFESDLNLMSCCTGGCTCQCESSCQHKSFFTDTLTKVVTGTLARMTLADVYNH